MDPFLVLLHSMSTRLSTSEVSDLKFLCQDRLSKRKLERVQSGIDLFSLLLEQNELDRENPERLRELLTSLKRQDLLRLLDDFEEGAEVTARQEEQDFHAAFDIICDHVGKDWRRLARQLKVPDSKIDAIEVKYPRNLSEQVRESLRVWKKAAREHATVSHLVQALRACRLNLVADLVEEDQQVRGLQLQSGSGGGTVSLKAWDSGLLWSLGICSSQPQHGPRGPESTSSSHSLSSRAVSFASLGSPGSAPPPQPADP